MVRDHVRAQNPSGNNALNSGQELALGLIIAIVLVRWLLPVQGQSSSKLMQIIAAATGGTAAAASTAATALQSGPATSVNTSTPTDNFIPRVGGPQ